MGQACGKLEVDLPCFDSPCLQKQHAEVEAQEDEVDVQVVVGLWPLVQQEKHRDSYDLVQECSELHDSAGSNIQSGSEGEQQRRRQRRARRSSQDHSLRPSICDSIVEARASSETSPDVHQQARRRSRALASGTPPVRKTEEQPEAPSPIEGLTLGAMVGRGSYGRVYKGMYNGSRVAVKVIDDLDSMPCNEHGVPLEAAISSAQEVDKQHAGLLLSLHCEFVAAGAGPKPRRLSAHSCSRTGSECWMLFDYCDKGCLADAVEKGWFSSSDDAETQEWEEYAPNLAIIATTAHEIASAMAHLHSQDIVHGDLSSSNIMLHSSDTAAHGFTAKVGDFGLATKAEDTTQEPPKRADTALTATACSTAQPAATAAAARPVRASSQIAPSSRRHSCSSISSASRALLTGSRTLQQQQQHGTVTHMPPEALIEQLPASKAGDVFAFGVLLWEMLTGERAWGGLGHAQVVFQVAVLRRSLELPRGLPPHLHTLLVRCMAPEPAARCTFMEAAQCLEQYLDQAAVVHN